MDILGFPGLITVFIFTLALVIPIMIRTLRQQQNVERDEHLESPTQNPLSAAGPPSAAVECIGCGQLNRVPLDATQALCGSCSQELNLSPSRAVG